MTNENSKPTQCVRIKEWLSKYGAITQLDALRDLGVMRLASRICEMRKKGEKISSMRVPIKNRWGETCYIKAYYLDNSEGTEG